jgi:hypothetical protein
MTRFGKDILLVGQNVHSAWALTKRLRSLGFRCHFAKDMRTAFHLLNSVRVDVLLSNTHLSDGTGFRLLEALAGSPVTAFLCLPVESSCFWLPTIDGGRECLGLQAPRPSEFASILEEMALSLTAAQPAN